MKNLDGVAGWVKRQGIPVTIGLIAAFTISFLISWFMAGTPFAALAFRANAPWTYATYALAHTGNGNDAFWFLLLMFWLYWVGGTFEREIGASRFGLVVALLTVIAALSAGLGGTLLLGITPALFGPGLMIAGLTVAWGMRHQTESIKLWGALPLTGLLLAILTFVLTLLAYGTGAPLLGVLACVPLAIAALWGTDRIPFFPVRLISSPSRQSKSERAREEGFLTDVKRREREREEQERLRKLFEGKD